LISHYLHRALQICFSIQLLSIGVVAQEQQFAALGDFKLKSGEVIRDCRIGYRTFGRLNEQKSNAIVLPTWASGTSEQLKSNIGPGRLMNSEKYFVIAIDALGNGVSSSPSNSKLQPRMRFPKFTLRDTVDSQHELLTKVLHLNHVKAVIGVPIVGSPRLASYDLLLWQAQIDAIVNDRDWNNGNYTTNPARVVEYEFGELLLTTPENYNKRVTRQQFFDALKKAKQEAGFDANDKIRQAQAMMALDVSEVFGGSMDRAAHEVRAKVFIIIARLDHVVTPAPALDFARLLQAKTLELDSDCGHLAPSCEYQKVNAAVAEFLQDN